MKNFRFLSYLLIAASSLVFMQCTSDYTAIPGQDGVDGVDGLDGVDGIDGVGTQVCIDCHSSTHRDPINDAYALSGHANGSTWVRGTSGSCARCHNNEGYIDYLSGLFVDSNGEQSADPDGYAVSNAITCTGCHDDHRSFDFENDGNDYALRNIDPIQLFIDPAVQLDMTNSVDPLGRSNTCINCHQPRNSYPVPTGTGDYTITSQRFGPHYGAQSTMLEGIMGANIVGTTGYPGRGTAAHKTGASCTTCHMGPTTDGTNGSHTWEPTPNACVTCHTGGAPTEVAGFAEDFATLQNLLLARKYISEAGDVLGGNGISNASSSNPLVVPVKEAQAIWNYRTFKQEHSNGVHNPIYAKALLKNSIEAIQN